MSNETGSEIIARLAQEREEQKKQDQNVHTKPLVLYKQLKTEEAADKFCETPTGVTIRAFIDECAAAVESVHNYDDQTMSAVRETGSSSSSNNNPFAGLIKALSGRLLPLLHTWVDQIPLQDMRKQRFGNKAFRDFISRLGDQGLGLTKEHVVPTLEVPATLAADSAQTKAATDAGRPSIDAERLAEELRDYLSDSFGNAQRLDYGTGHELHFFIFLYTAVHYVPQVGGATDSDFIASLTADLAAVRRQGLRDLILVVFEDYLALARRLQSHYSLEPAGSHGVWGLDDYHHLPYIFGASQLIGDESKGILPKTMTDTTASAQIGPETQYFTMIHWIHQNKKGPFFEHSPILYNISDIPEWARILRGMTKMHHKEVMGKFAVLQHFLFGSVFPPKQAQ